MANNHKFSALGSLDIKLYGALDRLKQLSEDVRPTSALSTRSTNRQDRSPKPSNIRSSPTKATKPELSKIQDIRDQHQKRRITENNVSSQVDPVISEQEILDAKNSLQQLKLKLKGFNDIIKVHDKVSATTPKADVRTPSSSRSPNHRIKGLTFRDQIINIISESKTPKNEDSFKPSFNMNNTPIKKEQDQNSSRSYISSVRVVKTIEDEETSVIRKPLIPSQPQQGFQKINFSNLNFISAIPVEVQPIKPLTPTPGSRSTPVNSKNPGAKSERLEENYSSNSKLPLSGANELAPKQQYLKKQIEPQDSPNGKVTPIKNNRKIEVSEPSNSPKIQANETRSSAVIKQNVDSKTMKSNVDSKFNPVKKSSQPAAVSPRKSVPSVLEKNVVVQGSSERSLALFKKNNDAESSKSDEVQSDLSINIKQSTDKKRDKSPISNRLNTQKKLSQVPVSTPKVSTSPELEQKDNLPETNKASTFTVEDNDQNQDDLRVECPEGCGRKFAPEVVARHAKACVKVFQTKRKKFDITSQRMNEDQVNLTETKSPLKPKSSKKAAATVQATTDEKQAKWKHQSEIFRANLKKARGDELTVSEEAAMQKASRKDDLVKCEYCLRRFSDNAAQRHIPFCKSKHKVDSLKKGSKGKTKKN